MLIDRLIKFRAILTTNQSVKRKVAWHYGTCQSGAMKGHQVSQVQPIENKKRLPGQMRMVCHVPLACTVTPTSRAKPANLLQAYTPVIGCLETHEPWSPFLGLRPLPKHVVNDEFPVLRKVFFECIPASQSNNRASMNKISRGSWYTAVKNMATDSVSMVCLAETGPFLQDIEQSELLGGQHS